MSESSPAPASPSDSNHAPDAEESTGVPTSPQHEGKGNWLIAVSTIAVSAALLLWARGHAANVGAHIPIAITIIPADAINLDCSSDATFDNVRCNFDAHARWQRVERPLRPYVTTGRELWLLSGVFEDPSVHQWLVQAQHSGSSARVTVECPATLLGNLHTVAVRWQTGAPFSDEHHVPVARVGACRVAR